MFLLNASIGKHITEKNTEATPNPVDLPNLCANSMYILNIAYMLANGTKNNAIYHNGNSAISNNTIILYTGTIAAHPGFPAFLYIFHMLTINSIDNKSDIIISITNGAPDWGCMLTAP